MRVEIAFECPSCNEKFDSNDDGSSCELCYDTNKPHYFCDDCKSGHAISHCFKKRLKKN